jgi:bacteriorhodopsin
MKLLLLLGSAIALPTFAADGATNLDIGDPVAISFWLVTAAMLACTVFFFVERDQVSAKWKTSLTVAGLITGIAFWHYLYMRGVWADTQKSPTVFRYIDWLLTVPLQMVEFYLILAACTSVAGSLFKKLLAGSLVMLIAGFIGELNGTASYDATFAASLAETGTGVGVYSGVMVPFVIGMLAWFYMIYELYMGEGKAAVSTASPAVNSAYNAMMLIIVFGWAIYPAGYAAGFLMGGGVYADNLNIIYNLADFVNKILFGLVIWHVAVKESSHSH